MDILVNNLGEYIVYKNKTRYVFNSYLRSYKNIFLEDMIKSIINNGVEIGRNIPINGYNKVYYNANYYKYTNEYCIALRD